MVETVVHVYVAVIRATSLQVFYEEMRINTALRDRPSSLPPSSSNSLSRILPTVSEEDGVMTVEVPSSPETRLAALAPPLSLTKRLVIAAASALNDAACRSDGTINRRLVSLLDPHFAASAKPARGVRTVDVPVDLARDLWFRLFVPSSDPAGGQIPVIVFFHGGGFAFLSPASYMYDDVCRRICRTVNAIVVSVNYRLAPEHRCPAQYEDGADVLRFLDGGNLLYADPSAAYLADLSSCFLVGDSAGANIVHHVARRWAADAGGGWKRMRLAGMVLIQPYFGGEERTEAELRLAGAPLVSVERTDWLWRAFLPEGGDRDHEASNVFGPRAVGELEEALPPAMVIVGGFDPLQDWQRRYYKGLRARGKTAQLVEYPEAFHAFYAFPDLKQSTVIMEDIKSFINSHRPPKQKKEVVDGDALCVGGR